MTTLLLLAALAWLALPIWAAIAAANAKRRAERLEAELEMSRRLAHEVARLDETVRDLSGRFDQLQHAAPPEAPAPLRPLAEPPRMPPPAFERPRPPATAAPPPAAVPPRPAPASGPPAPVPAVTTPPPPPPPAAMDWERWISVRGFAWLGGGALFLAAAFFLQHAIQRDLISEAARVWIGLIIGAAALAGGELIRPKAGWAGQSTSGAGVAILYASVYAAHNLYGLVSLPTAFVAMTLITLAAGALALQRGVFVVAVLGTLGGFLTPYLLPTAGDRALPLFLYVLLLDAGVILVTRKRHWVSLPILALAGTVSIYASWAVRFLHAGNVAVASGAAVVLGALFLFGLPRGLEPEKRDTTRGTVFFSIIGLHVLGIAVAASPKLLVSPALLVAYLLVSAAAAVAGRKLWELTGIQGLSAALALLAMTIRVRSDLFPGRALEAFLVFSVLGAAFFVAWLLDREKDETLTAAAIALGGHAAVLLRVILLEAPTPVFAEALLYAGIHAAMLLATGVLLSSGKWILAAHASVFVALAAGSLPFSDDRLAVLLVPIAVSGITFWALPFLSARYRVDGPSWLSSSLAPVLHYALLYILAKPHWGKRPLGLLALLIAAAGLGAVALARRRIADPSERREVLTLIGTVAALFAVVAVPLLLEKEWIPIAWAVEAAGLAWLGSRIAHSGPSAGSAFLSGLVLIMLLFNPALWQYHPRSGVPVLNWYLYTFAVPALAFLAAARWASRDPHATAFRFPQILRAASGVLFFVLLNVEIADVYSKGSRLEFRIFGGGLAQDMTYSIAWGIFGLVLLVLGIAYRSKAVRASALAVVVLTVGKVFLHDLWSLGALYRVGSIVGLAISLLAVSFLTQRFVFTREP